MFPGNTYQGRYIVTEDGSLQIKGAIRKDEGHYVCSAISQAGASTATAFLQASISSYYFFRLVNCSEFSNFMLNFYKI